MQNGENVSTTRNVKVMITPKWYLIQENPHFKTTKIDQEEKTTESDKKPAFQQKMYVCAILKRHEQPRSNS